jgi:hypothetical protein
VIAEVTAAMQGAHDYYWECLRVPIDCDVGRFDIPGGDSHAVLTRTRDDLIAAELYVDAEDVGYMVIESVEPMEDHVLVTSCWYVTAVLYGPPGLDGALTVQNDTPSWGRQTDQFVRDPADGQWRIRRSDSLEEGEEENGCPPEPVA